MRNKNVGTTIKNLAITIQTELRDAKADIKRIESQRDELLAALKIIANPDSNHPAFVSFDHIDTAYEQIAREAIAKVEGLQE